MERQELEERLNCRKVSVEMDLLNQHLQKRGNGADIHPRLGTIRQNFLFNKAIALTFGDSTFEAYKQLKLRMYDDLLNDILESISKYNYKC